MAIWTEETEDRMISMIQDRPALYDVSDKRYANRAVKRELWREIANKLVLSEKELRKRWDSLRTQYTRYKKLAPSGCLGAQKTGRQQWILNRLQFLEPHTKRKETTSNPKSPSAATTDSDSLAIASSESWTGNTVESCFFKVEPKPESPLAESTICGAESILTHHREEPLPRTSSQSSTETPRVKRSRQMMDECASEESTDLMHTIGKTLERLASQEAHSDDISAYCKNIEHRMRKLPPHLLPHFQHEVDNCLFKYSTGCFVSQSPVSSSTQNWLISNEPVYNNKMSDGAELLVELKQRVGCCIDEGKAKLHSLSTDIWSCPEMAYEERKSHDRLVAFFSQEKGWTVDRHFKLETAFRAIWGAGGREQGDVVNVGFLCEYDALPGIGHACGHNLIAEVGAAAAVGLKAVLENTPNLPVRVQVTVLGTPAEEDGGGKIDMLREGAFDDLDVVFMAHPSKEDAVYLPCVAEHDVTIKYHGKASHASAYPWEGINALDAAVLCYNNLSVLRQQMKPDWRVHGVIKHGGVKPNIIPAYSELEYYLRTPSRSELPVLEAKAERCFRSAAVETGCEVEVEFARNTFDNILRNTTLEELYQRNGKALGMDFITDEELLKNESGSTDFGNVTFVVPGIHPYFYIGSNALNYTQEYTVAAGDAAAQFFTLRSAKALVMTALDVLLCPELLQRVKQEFTEAKLKEDAKLTGEHTQQSATHC